MRQQLISSRRRPCTTSTEHLRNCFNALGFYLNFVFFRLSLTWAEIWKCWRIIRYYFKSSGTIRTKPYLDMLGILSCNVPWHIVHLNQVAFSGMYKNPSCPEEILSCLEGILSVETSSVNIRAVSLHTKHSMVVYTQSRLSKLKQFQGYPSITTT